MCWRAVEGSVTVSPGILPAWGQTGGDHVKAEGDAAVGKAGLAVEAGPSSDTLVGARAWRTSRRRSKARGRRNPTMLSPVALSARRGRRRRTRRAVLRREFAVSFCAAIAILEAARAFGHPSLT
jgi:hypothetical protein